MLQRILIAPLFFPRPAGARRSAPSVSRFLATGLIACGTWVGGCDQAPSSVTWREQVSLSDGQIILVEREERWANRTALGGPAETETIAATVRALDPPDAFPPWSRALVPQVLDRDPLTGEFYVIGYAEYCDQWRAEGAPEVDRIEYRLGASGQWRSVPLHAEHVGRSSNLLVNLARLKDYPNDRPVPLELKRHWNDGPIAREFKTIAPVRITHCPKTN